MILKVDKASQVLEIVQATRGEIAIVRKHLTRHVDGYMFDPRYKMKIWSGKETMFPKDGRIPIGLWKEVYTCCHQEGISLSMQNKEDFPLNRAVDDVVFNKWVTEFFKDTTVDGVPFMPRPYQVDAVLKILKNRYCNIQVATSGGKTLIYSMFVLFTLSHKSDARFLLSVPSTTLVTQFYDDIVAFNNGLEGSNQMSVDLVPEEVMSDKPRKAPPGVLPNLVIGTYQSLVDMKKGWTDQFFAVTVDEAHGLKSTDQNKVMKRAVPGAYYRFGMSGTFPDPNSFEMLKILAVTGPIVADVSAAELQEQGYISPVSIKILYLNYNESDFHDRVVHIRKGDGKTAYELEKDKAQNSQGKMRVLKKICAAAKDNTLVLFNNKDYGKSIADAIRDIPGIDVHYIDGDVKNKERGKIKQIMEETSDGKVRILVASYGTLSTGVSIKAITNVVLADSFKSKIRILQSIGRSLRLHKKKNKAYIFDLVDVFDRTHPMENVLWGHAHERKSIYRKEQYPFQEMWIDL